MLPSITPAEEATRSGQIKNKARERYLFTSGTQKKCPQISRNGTKFFKARNKSVSICEICGNKITRSTLFGIFGFARVHYIIYCIRSLGCGGKSHFGLTYFFFQVFVNIERTLNIQPSFCIYEFFVDSGIINGIESIKDSHTSPNFVPWNVLRWEKFIHTTIAIAILLSFAEHQLHWILADAGSTAPLFLLILEKTDIFLRKN